MACYHPIHAYKLANGGVAWVERSTNESLGDLRLPCGQCIGCRLERSRYWAARCLHESQMHAKNSWVTLTYDEEHLPEGGTLQYSDVQAFHHRLRKALGPFRFFLCGEYGEQLGRPHYHACYFGLMPDDLVPWQKRPFGQTYTSPSLIRLWGKGNVVVAALSPRTAAYTARYTLKKITGKPANDHYQTCTQDGVIVHRVPEFARMSNRPGIGATWFAKYGKSDLAYDYTVMDGVRSGTPDYYDKLLARSDPELLETRKAERTRRAAKHAANNTEARLAVRETVVTARTQTLKRTL